LPVVTTDQDDEEARKLLRLTGLPFRKQLAMATTAKCQGNKTQK
jgi:hypothetical protein